MIYELDHIDRGHSDTLWMQLLKLVPSSDATETELADGDTFGIDVHIADHQLLELPSGRWRNVDLRGDANGVAMSATFAHRIPSEEGASS